LSCSCPEVRAGISDAFYVPINPAMMYIEQFLEKSNKIFL